MKVTWVAVRGPGVDRMTTRIGATRKVVITGLSREFVGNCDLSFDLPEGAEIHDQVLPSAQTPPRYPSERSAAVVAGPGMPSTTS